MSGTCRVPKKTFETFHKAHATRMANAADSGGGGVGQKFELQDNMPKVLNEIMYMIYHICLESVRMSLKGITCSFCSFFFSISSTEYTYTATIRLIEKQPFVGSTTG